MSRESPQMPKVPLLSKLRIGLGFFRRRIQDRIGGRMEMPKSFIPGMIPTLNDMGFMTDCMDEYSKAFVDYAGTCKNPVLDMGCAYGVASLPALASGATLVACDMEKGHVDILAHRTPEKDRARLTIDTGTMPDKDYPSESFDAVLAARVLHYMTPETIEASVAKMTNWLKPGGKLFLVSDTVHTAFWKNYAPTYEEKKAAGDLWPGVITDAKRFLPEPARKRTNVNYMNFLDPDVLTRVVENSGLVVERVGFVKATPEDEGQSYAQSDRERAGIIARKPI